MEQMATGAGDRTPYHNIIDVGCGAGFTAAAMSSLADRVLATDFTPEMVHQAHRVARERQAHRHDGCHRRSLIPTGAH